jgi:phosphoadenosine phosphosulfate reductase
VLSAVIVPDTKPVPLPAPAGETRLDLTQVNARLESLTAKERVRWAVEQFGDRVILLSSMQKTAVVLMHMFYELGLTNEVLFVDTGYHFFETLRMRDEYMRRFHLNLVTLYPATTIEQQEAEYGTKLFNSVAGQPECCRMRKEEPLLGHLRTKQAPVLLNGLRRAEGGKRANIRALGPDRRTGGYQLSPIFDWTTDDVQAYIARNDLPIHPLHEQGYPSIGCYPCTTPVQPGEDERAGRWRHLRVLTDEAPQYCNINFSDGAGI